MHPMKTANMLKRLEADLKNIEATEMSEEIRLSAELLAEVQAALELVCRPCTESVYGRSLS
jgi:hypothetical protein